MDRQDPSVNRYHRQILLPPIGPAGQRRLGQSRILLVGCGALGSVIADQLARAGVGELRLADRDIVEITNLQRQVLFDEEDVRQGMPKAAAAAARLAKVNSSITITPLIVDVHAGNVLGLAGVTGSDFQPVNLIIDGTDNAQSRYLINDVAVKYSLPWVYGGCVGFEGRVMPIVPGKTPCLRCLFPQPPETGELPTCDTAGVLGPAATVTGALQAAVAIRLLLGENVGEQPAILSFDIWQLRFAGIAASIGPRADCPCCGQRRFEFLEGGGPRNVSLCGRNAVQISPAALQRVDLDSLSLRLAACGKLQRTAYFLRCELADVPQIMLTIFPDGRLLVAGTEDVSQARAIAARYVGV